ncbi:hypothetical protein [Burkholderia ubonensis]|uniref:hypothetical protein n=1 Tax=Burkholderia ubonensis TaxID=101571 RepID=UPI0008FDB350|nr:hypothetical protein [Burkholderia ubonensis]
MSYEYRLVFDDAASAQHVMDSLKSSDACVKVQALEVCLKDRELQTLAEYDARLTQEDDRSIWLEVNFRSPNLYNLVRGALSGRIVRCFEDGDWGDEVTLKQAIRIKKND